MKNLTYTGDLADGYVEEPGSNHQFPFRKGEPVLLPDDLAISLLANPDWREANAAPAKTSKQNTEG